MKAFIPATDGFQKKERTIHGNQCATVRSFSGREFDGLGEISKNLRTPLVFLTRNVTSESYAGQIREPEVIPVMIAYSEVWIFQQDNVPAHSSVRTTRFI